MSEVQTNEGSLPIRVTIPREILSQDIDEEVVILNPQTEHYHGLDVVGARAWQLLREQGQQANVEPVVKQLLQEYDVDETTLRHDLANLFRELSQAGLVTLEDLP